MDLLERLWSGLLGLLTQFVIPDWGALIALLPVFIGVVVVLFLLGVVARYRRLNPARRRPGRIAPVTPPGVHMPGPTYAPIFAAVGAFLLFMGLVFNGLILVLGLIALILTLLYWGREGLTDYDHVAGDHPQLPAVVHAGPPPGVHMPGPSFRPFLASLGVAVLFAGLVFGGWVLVVGLVFTITALLGWLNDARKEYRQVVRADRPKGAPVPPDGGSDGAHDPRVAQRASRVTGHGPDRITGSGPHQDDPKVTQGPTVAEECDRYAPCLPTAPMERQKPSAASQKTASAYWRLARSSWCPCVSVIRPPRR